MSSRLKSLDSLRGIAALNVVLTHYTHVYNVKYKYEYKDYFSWEIGTRGVELFFVISGFVIFNSLSFVKTEKEFLIKRFIRLYPTYWLCLILTFTVISIFGLPNLIIGFKEFILGFTMIPQIFGALKVDDSYWTLVPELFFYLFMVSLFYLRLLQKIEFVGLFWLVLSIIHIHFYHIPFLGLFLSLDYAPFFLAGILSYKLREEKSIFRFVLFACCAIIGLSKFALWSGEFYFILIVFLVFAFLVWSDLKLLENKFLIKIGVISYPLYLIHQNIGYVIINYSRPYFTNMSIILLPIIIGFLLAFLINQFYEIPIMKKMNTLLLKKREYSNKSQAIQ